MPSEQESSTCGNPGFEETLLDPRSLAQWKGSPIAWIEASPHRVEADLVTERDGLVMIDTGATRADFTYGARSMSWDFTPGSIGLFAKGTELKLSRWRWTRTRRIYLDLEAALPGCRPFMDSFRDARHHTELEFRDSELTSVLRTMVREIAGGNPNGRLFAESLSLGVAMRLQDRAATRYRRLTERGKLTQAHVHRLEELVASDLGKDIPLSELAAATGLSPPQFVRLFKNTLGCTPHQYVLKARLSRAKDLVVGSDLSLAAVADAAGFSNQSHMTSAFVRAFDTPPGQMRRSRRASAERHS